MQGAFRGIARLIGLVLAVALTDRWYVAWLNRYLAWNPLQYFLPQALGTLLFAILSAPAIPIAIVLEWF